MRQGMPVELHVLRAPPPSGEPPAPLPASVAGRIAASVTDSMPTGQTVLSTVSGTVVVQARAVLPAGTLVALGLPAASAPSFAPFHQTDWPNLRMAIDALTAADPGGVPMLLARVLPQAGPHLAAAIAHFTAVTRHGGDTRRWLGDRAAQLLDAVDGGRALSGLAEDLRTLGRQAAEPLQGDWRAYSLPFADGHAVARIQLFVRNAGEDEKDEDGRAHGRGAKRFIVDAELSRIGPLQLDGLMRDRRFDLILRTHEPLPADMRQDIQRLFAVTVEALGLTGAVSFQGSGQGWLTLAPMPATTGRGVVA
ncbi:MAG TPA: hypothetical protein VK943_15235 [Arenibaculum sp.]|nr:hypothetical protein [Arenibaculum sp.]